MRICTDDGRFGVVISPTGAPYDSGFFTFQLSIDGVVIGDTEPSIVFQAVERLQRLEEFDDARLSPETADVTTVLNVVLGDVDLHDRLSGSWAESLDQWCLLAYVCDDDAVWIAQAYDDQGRLAGPVLATRVPINAYTDVATRVGSYWREHSGSAK